MTAPAPGITLVPDLAEAKRFLCVMAGNEPITFQTFTDNKTLLEGSKKDPAAKVRHGSLAQHAELLTALQQERSAGVYWMVNRGDGSDRSTANVIGVRALFADLDGAPLEPVLEAGLEPHAVVESSPGRYHAYWLVEDCPLEKFKPLQKAIAARFGSGPKVSGRVGKRLGLRSCTSARTG